MNATTLLALVQMLNQVGPTVGPIIAELLPLIESLIQDWPKIHSAAPDTGSNLQQVVQIFAKHMTPTH